MVVNCLVFGNKEDGEGEIMVLWIFEDDFILDKQVCFQLQQLQLLEVIGISLRGTKLRMGYLEKQVSTGGRLKYYFIILNNIYIIIYIIILNMFIK